MKTRAPKGTIMLVHGSWAGGWIWDEVAASLRADGWRVAARTLPGLAERADTLSAETDHEVHAGDLVDAIAALGPEPIVLVGHSYGALVTTIAAARVPHRIAKLVTVDGFLPEQGRSLFDLHPELQGLLEANLVAGSSWQVAALPAAALGVPDGARAVRYDLRTSAMPIATHARPVNQDFTPLAGLARHYLRCTQFPVFASTAQEAARQGWHCSDIDAGHMVMLTDPEALARKLAAIAKA